MKTFRSRQILSLVAFLSSITAVFAYEKPESVLLEKEGKFELRKYSEMTLISTPMKGMENRGDSFRKLFGYIGGGNAKKQKISMTVPVITQDNAGTKNAERAGTMSFVVPTEVVKAGAPKPNDQNIVVKKMPAAKYATLQFKGGDDEGKRKIAVDNLKAIVKKKSLKTVGKPFFSSYDPPFKPEFLRKNEVWIQVK
jgi:predicted transcriptional regulator YdeE